MKKQPIIVLFVGIPGSGKTTFSRALAEKLRAVLLNSDSIRIWMWGSLEEIHKNHETVEGRADANKLTFGALNYAANQVLASGQNVVYDCNANHVSERQEKHNIADKNGALSVVVRMRVPYEVSLERVQYRDEAHDQRRFSLEKAETILQRFSKEIEEPDENERVIFIDGQATFDEQYAVFEKALTQFYE